MWENGHPWFKKKEEKNGVMNPEKKCARYLLGILLEKKN